MKNLSKILVVALLALFSINAYAQNAGFKIGLSMANTSLSDEGWTMDEKSKILFAPKLGFTFETPFNENLFLQTGLFASVSGNSFNATRMVQEGEFDFKEVDSKNKYILLYIDLPVNFGYKHEIDDGLSIFGMAGPVFRYLTYSTLAFKLDGEDWDNEATHEGEGDDKVEYFKNFDLGLNIEAGVQVDRFQFSLYYSPSLTNIVSDDLNDMNPMDEDLKWKNYSFGLNVNILFGQLDNSRRY